MPIYEYECESCNMVTEVMQKISEEPLKTCPDCSGSLKKLLSQSAFHLKGGGWYADGYSSSNGCGGKNGKTVPGSSCPAKKESTSSKKESAPACNSCPATSS